MRIWRISNYLDLSGRGGLISAGRWHRVGTPVVYASDHPATALLETLAHLNVERVPENYQLIGIDVPDDAPLHKLDIGDLQADWRSDFEHTQKIGTTYLKRATYLAILVPTVLIPVAWNALLNPMHPDAHRCAIGDVLTGTFDPRLIR